MFTADVFGVMLIPLAGTVAGSAFVFFVKGRIPSLMEKCLLGFAAGVMVAAAVWSLLLPSIEMSASMGRFQVVPAISGLLLGFAFLFLIDRFTPHIDFGTDTPEGPASRLSRTGKLVLAITIHNIPEGMAVGVVLATALQTPESVMPMAAAMAVAVGISIQNVPEGAIVAMPVHAAGNSRRKAFWVGSLSGVVEPIGTVLTLLLASIVTPVLPYFLAFAAGAMLYVVVEELIPEASRGKHSDMATVGFAVGFAVMMMLDVILG